MSSCAYRRAGTARTSPPTVLDAPVPLLRWSSNRTAVLPLPAQNGGGSAGGGPSSGIHSRGTSGSRVVVGGTLMGVGGVSLSAMLTATAAMLSPS